MDDCTDPGSLDYVVDIAKSVRNGDDIVYDGKLTFYRDKNPNGLAPELHPEADGGGPSLKLAVRRDAYLKAKHGSPDSNDRCELRDAKLRLGTPVWYSFDIRIAADFPVVDARCVCAQLKAPYYDANGGSPLFALRIDRGHYVATIEHLYEIKDTRAVDGTEISRHVRRHGSPGATGARALDHHVFGNTADDFKELQVRAVLATDSRGLPAHLEDEFRWCTDLVGVRQERPLPDDIYRWHRFTVRVAPTSVKDEDGFLQLFADDTMVATAIGEFGHAGYRDPKGNDGPHPDQARQYFKIGPYRDKIALWGGRTAAIYIRNIRRGGWADGKKLRSALHQ